MSDTRNFKLYIIAVSIGYLGLLYYGYKYKTGIFSTKEGKILGGVLTVVISLWVVKMVRSVSVENYGGPIKNTRKIPMTDCYKFCDNNYGMCTHMYRGDNVGKCDAQWRACRAECYFPNIQRMY